MRKRTCFSGFVILILTLSTHLGAADVTPGMTISTANMAQADGAMTPIVQWMVTRGMTMQIIETKKVARPRAYQEATEKYAKQVKLSDDGKELLDYVAGCPFPLIDIADPLAGVRVMWNHAHGPYITDNAGAHFVGDLLDNRGMIERTYEGSWRRLMWTGRLYTDPKPQLAHNPPLRQSNLFGPFFLPNELKGLLVLDLRYISATQPDDTYAYFPERRRVSRFSIADRGGPLGSVVGTDYDIDSFLGFSPKLNLWTFRILAEKDILAIVHSGKYGDRSAWCAARDANQGFTAALPCLPWEKRRVWIIEAIPTGYDGLYPISKRILYVDQETFFPIIAELYDHRDELWKGLVHCLFYTKKPYAAYPAHPPAGMVDNYQEEWPFLPQWVLIDVQQVYATVVESPSGAVQPGAWHSEWYFNEPVRNNRPDMYSMNSLLQGAR